MTNHDKILSLLKIAGNRGVSGYDLTYLHGIKQAPTRIWELIHQKHYLIKTRPYGKTVLYILLGDQRYEEPVKEVYRPERQKQQWEMNQELVRVVHGDGHVTWEEPEDFGQKGMGI